MYLLCACFCQVWVCGTSKLYLLGPLHGWVRLRGGVQLPHRRHVSSWDLQCRGICHLYCVPCWDVRQRPRPHDCSVQRTL
jgi:hypothetical protein